LARQFSLMLAFMGAGLMVLALPWAPWPFAFWSLFGMAAGGGLLERFRSPAVLAASAGAALIAAAAAAFMRWD